MRCEPYCCFLSNIIFFSGIVGIVAAYLNPKMITLTDKHSIIESPKDDEVYFLSDNVKNIHQFAQDKIQIAPLSW